MLGPLPEAELIAIDGKTLRSARRLEIVNAYAPGSGRWLGSERVEEGGHEITAARLLATNRGRSTPSRSDGPRSNAGPCC